MWLSNANRLVPYRKLVALVFSMGSRTAIACPIVVSPQLRGRVMHYLHIDFNLIFDCAMPQTSGEIPHKCRPQLCTRNLILISFFIRQLCGCIAATLSWVTTTIIRTMVMMMMTTVVTITTMLALHP